MTNSVDALSARVAVANNDGHISKMKLSYPSFPFESDQVTPSDLV